MPSRKRRRRIENLVVGLDGQRRYAWWRALSAEEKLGQATEWNEVLRTNLLELVRSVLHQRNVDAFRLAWRIQGLIDEFDRRSEAA